MAWGYRNRRRYYRRRYYRRGYGSKTSRRAYGNMKAARQQADNATFTLNVPSKICSFMKTGVQLPGLATGDTRTVGVYPISIYELLRRNEFFNNYANMYDEFKIDKIKVKLLPTSFTINTNGNYRNLTVYTAWDRTGLNTNQLYGYYDKARPENNAIYCTIGEDITTYSSAESRTVNPNTNTSITRWLNPKTMGEKGQWLSTSLLKQWFVGYDDENGCFKGIQFNDGDQYAAEINAQSSVSNALLKFSAASKENPCFLLEDPAIKFKPTLLVGVFPAVAQADFATNNNHIHFNVETEIVCTYRGLRKARVINATTEQGQNLIVAPKPAAIESNGTYYATTDGFNGYSSVTVAVPQSGGGGTTVNNADVAPNDNNIIRSNGSFQVPQGKTGWNSFSVSVSDDTQIPQNRLSITLTDDAVSTAQNRTDTFSNGAPLRNLVDWPKQGQVEWTNIATIPDANAKWVDSALIDVSGVHLAEDWSQSSPLNLSHVQTTYRQGHDVSNATYPEDFNFTTESGIKFNNDNSLINNLVTLRNQYVNCLSTALNVGNITQTSYTNPQQPTPQEIQNEINANPVLQPSTHGAYAETITEDGQSKQVVHFTFELTDGNNSKTTSSGGSMDVDPVPLPRLYARKVEGYFDLPQIAPNTRITQPGRYALGNFVGTQQQLELEQVTNNNNATPLPNQLKLIKKDSKDGDSNPNENEFSFGTFTVDIPSQDNTLTKFAYILETEGIPDYSDDDPIPEPIPGPTLNFIDPLAGAISISHGQTETTTFKGLDYQDDHGQTVNDEGQWACIYWNSAIYGSFIFNVHQNEEGVVKLENFTSSDTLYRTFIKFSGPISTDQGEFTVTNGYFKSLCNENGDDILPLANSQEFEFANYNSQNQIHFQINNELNSLPNSANQEYNNVSIRRYAFTAPYSSLYTITDTPPLTSKRSSSSKKQPVLRTK